MVTSSMGDSIQKQAGCRRVCVGVQGELDLGRLSAYSVLTHVIGSRVGEYSICSSRRAADRATLDLVRPGRRRGRLAMLQKDSDFDAAKLSYYALPLY